jgi:hypothetical protein
MAECLMEKPITRPLLATFFEYAATQRVTLLEWHRFAVNHYHDERMEEARRECVRIIQRAKRGEVPRVDVERLFNCGGVARERMEE